MVGHKSFNIHFIINLLCYTSRTQEYPIQGAHLFADSHVVKTGHSSTMPAFLRLALDENLHGLNGAFLSARGIYTHHV